MRKIIERVFILLLLISLSCCIMPRETKNVLRKSYTDQYTGLDTIINIQGLYYIRIPEHEVNEVNHPYDTIYNTYMFYPNGFFKVTLSTDIIEQKDDLKERRASYFGYGYHGCYKLTGDTIKAVYVDPPGGMTWYAGGKWFKIINNNTIEVIAGEGRSLYYMDSTSNYICNFKELFFIPPYHKSWLIRKKWFWKNKEDYKRWKKEQRKKKRS